MVSMGSIADSLELAASQDMRSFVYEKGAPIIEHYVTKHGEKLVFLNPFLIWEFHKPIAYCISFWRWAIVDLLRVWHVLLLVRFHIPMFGIMPYDEGWMQVFYEITGRYIDKFQGIMPTMGGIDVGLLFSFYFVDRLDTLLCALIIIDHAGQRF